MIFIYNQIVNDNLLVSHYKQIEEFEDHTGGWAYHNWVHVTNVALLVEKILSRLNVTDTYIEHAKIASILHDTGALEGKINHAERGMKFAEKYFKKNSIEPIYKKEILSSIKNHSNGFDSTELMTLALIVSDKLDITKSRLAKEGYNVIGMRQLQYINNVELLFSNNTFIVNFETDKNIDLIEWRNFYFINKVFTSVKVFAKKINFDSLIKVNGKLLKI